MYISFIIIIIIIIIIKFYDVKFKLNQLSLLKTKGAMTRSKAR